MRRHLPKRRARRAFRSPVAAILGVVALAATGCRTVPESDPRFRPTENVLEIVTVLRRHVPDDTYRFEPARDFSGRNIYRASLIRLENLEQVHANVLRAGHLDDVIAFSKARSLERLRAYDLAAEQYREAARHEGPLELEALQSAAICDALEESTRLGYDPSHRADAGEASEAPVEPIGHDDVIVGYDQRVALLEALLDEVEGTHFEAIVREEIERADLARSRFFAARRLLDRDGNVRALGETQRVVVRHRESKNANRNLLMLADLYADIARDYVLSHPPEGLLFDPPVFQDLVDSASRLYQAVANQDGSAEKLAATRRLEAFLAFTLKVDHDRFTQ